MYKTIVVVALLATLAFAAPHKRTASILDTKQVLAEVRQTIFSIPKFVGTWRRSSPGTDLAFFQKKKIILLLKESILFIHFFFPFQS